MRDALHIYRKEIREMMRDKRVRSGALFMPLVTVAMVFFLIGMMVTSMTKKENLRISVVNPDHPIAKALSKDMTVLPVKDEATAESLIKSGKAHLVLVFPSGAPVPGQPIRIPALFDKSEEGAASMLASVQQSLEKANQVTLQALLKSVKLNPELSQPVALVKRPIQVGSEAGASGFLLQLLPYMVVIWAFYGVIGTVADLVAGEKEKQTLETLLISPVERRDVAFGKFLALTQISLMSCLSALAGIILMTSVKLPGISEILRDSHGPSFLSIILIILSLVPTSAMFAAILLAISTQAKNIREAQTRISLVSVIALMPAMASQVIGYMDIAGKLTTYTIPVLNSAALIRSSLQGKLTVGPVLVTILVNFALAAIALWYTIKLFRKESVLVRV